MSTHARNNTTNKFKLPEMVDPDMENGLESVSCELAKKFYEHHSKDLHKMKDRDEIRRLYVSTVGKWASSRDGPGSRHFNQVLYALCRDGNVCRVTNEGKNILWKANIPRVKLVERCDRLETENRELKEKLKRFCTSQDALADDNAYVTPIRSPPGSPPGSPLSNDVTLPFDRPMLKRQMTCSYEDSPLHMAPRRRRGIEEGEEEEGEEEEEVNEFINVSVV